MIMLNMAKCLSYLRERSRPWAWGTSQIRRRISWSIWLPWSLRACLDTQAHGHMDTQTLYVRYKNPFIHLFLRPSICLSVCLSEGATCPGCYNTHHVWTVRQERPFSVFMLLIDGIGCRTLLKLDLFVSMENFWALLEDALCGDCTCFS